LWPDKNAEQQPGTIVSDLHWRELNWIGVLMAVLRFWRGVARCEDEFSSGTSWDILGHLE
jgi:hypothetical protein